MCQEFYWTAKLFEADKVQDVRYFATKDERDEYVDKHFKWKKRGKICAKNLSRHLQEPLK